MFSGGTAKVELLREDMKDWRITLVDTGLDASIGERLLAVRPYLNGADMFLANYSDGLTDCPLPAVVERLHTAGAVGVFMVVRPSISLHFVRHARNGVVTAVLNPAQADAWVNAGFFVFRQKVFDFLQPGEELVEEPFERLIAQRRLAVLPYSGFWRCCDTFKDLQTLESLLRRGNAPWEVWRRRGADGGVIQALNDEELVA